ncbi:MAG: hypothetical protein JOY74_09155 [Sinobacteraceae bacterium]|nr:hypothetical protein [Nevskiaceae bacterium]MBV9316368.1 hypothetical protein [Gammaproteobacteria bacterium]MBV9725157.1 hypothetical protein [Gammaproteobacteria bacterium]
MERQQGQGSTSTGGTDSIQGEGDYRAAREYREDVREFLERTDVEKAAREAAPRSPQEARELEEAEATGRSRARGASRRGQAAARSLTHVVRDRPVTAMVIAGVLGGLVAWAGRRGSRRPGAYRRYDGPDA